MNIEIKKQYNIIKPFVIELPDLVVLTGENGSGKTQLLNYIAATTGAVLDEEVQGNMPEPFYITETGEGIPSLIITNDGNPITSIEYQSVRTPRIELGKYFNVKTVINEGNTLIPKFFFFSIYHEDILKKETNISQIESDYLNYLQFKKSPNDYHNRDVTFPRFTQKDLSVVKTIYDKHGAANPYLVPYYYIVYLPVPNQGTFSANIKFLYLQYWARRKAGMDVGVAPWESFNNVAEAAGFRYILDIPKIDEDKFDVLLRDKETGTILDADSLSSGEKVILSLILAMYTSLDKHHPELLLLDEPDAYLHPSLSHKMLDVIQNVLIKKYGIKVIFTTHSPSTVALAPEESVFSINRDRGVLEKCTKNQAIQVLTSGLSSLSIYYEKVFQVFVEADNDNNYLSQIYSICRGNGVLSSDTHLNFVNLDQNKNGGCTKVCQTVNLLKEAGNKTVLGVIDWDGKNNGNDKILILGNGTRYAVDNYILDPLAVSFLFLEESDEKIKIGFDKHDSIVSVKNKSTQEWQNLINCIVSGIHNHLTDVIEGSEDPVQYETLDGKHFTLPKWFVNNKGHKIREAYEAAFPFLKKYRNEKTLYNKIINICYLNYSGFIPNEIICTLNELQNRDICN